MAQIVGLLLVKNEDIHIQWVINNILDFCDHIMVLDNHSTEHTWEILEHLAGKTDKIAAKSLRWMKPLGSRPGTGSSIHRNVRRRLRNYAVGNIVTVDTPDFRPPASGE